MKTTTMKTTDGYITSNTTGRTAEVRIIGELFTNKQALIGGSLLLLSGAIGIVGVAYLCRKAWHNGTRAYAVGLDKVFNDLGIIEE